ncbi:hypothetical protein [Aliicoccus persicus]|uniref:Uncharacterized protein n=1 Tax=Aliicoccus persicus TaxID=930138 RepID=A0A662Z2I1_9STAP|nr:hypothetical protein [Aliicoccus persicus]SEV84565.1 hypothetical protein SAMN05192557_0433 [Aliicoccus persicus]
MKHIVLKNDGFVSITMYIFLVYLYQVFYYYYNKIIYIIEIRKNLIEIYNQKLIELMG